ncbi:MAG: hypothetical protein O2987_01060 [Firmicutes bacterium]|nr:hypothetical protein [Bacillota bacterium]
MRYSIAIDGGGTKTAMVIVDSTHTIIKEAFYGPSSLDTVDISYLKRYLKTFLDSCEYFFSAVYIGLGGILSPDDKKPLFNLVKEIVPMLENCNIYIENDIDIAFLLSDNPKSSMVSIIGTGTVCYGKHNNRFHRASGWSYYEGDEGSAYHLGLQSVLDSIKAFDFRKEDTDFLKFIRKQIEIHGENDILSKVKEFRLNRTETAALAKFVTSFGFSDSASKEIMIDGANKIVDAMEAVYKRLGFKKTTCLIIGSLGHDPVYFKCIENIIKNRKLEIVLQLPKSKPHIHAAKYIL